jgi:hypothetical protein
VAATASSTSGPSGSGAGERRRGREAARTGLGGQVFADVVGQRQQPAGFGGNGGGGRGRQRRGMAEQGKGGRLHLPRQLAEAAATLGGQAARGGRGGAAPAEGGQREHHRHQDEAQRNQGIGHRPSMAPGP